MKLHNKINDDLVIFVEELPLATPTLVFISIASGIGLATFLVIFAIIYKKIKHKHKHADLPTITYNKVTQTNDSDNPDRQRLDR